MTTQEIIDYYTGLLIIQYEGLPKATGHVAALVTPMIMDQLPAAVRDAFTLGTAVGAQLDVIGKYAGVSRIGYTPRGVVTLGDSDFTQLIYLILIKNTSGSSLAEIQALLAAQFPNQIRVSDNQTMQLNYVVAKSLGGQDLLDMLVYNDYLPRPMGVQTSVTVLNSLATRYYGWRTYTTVPPNTSPINHAAFYQTTYPWLSYSGVN